MRLLGCFQHHSVKRQSACDSVFATLYKKKRLCVIQKRTEVGLTVKQILTGNHADTYLQILAKQRLLPTPNVSIGKSVHIPFNYGHEETKFCTVFFSFFF